LQMWRKRLDGRIRPGLSVLLRCRLTGGGMGVLLRMHCIVRMLALRGEVARVLLRAGVGLHLLRRIGGDLTRCERPGLLSRMLRGEATVHLFLRGADEW
jgi:hypothetical protein